MEDFVFFRKMITPVIVQILFWIGVIVVVLTGLVTLIAGIFKLSFYWFLTGILWIILGPLVLRIYAEVTLLVFRIYDRLGEIHDSLKAGK
jgi:hypothetical protein